MSEYDRKKEDADNNLSHGEPGPVVRRRISA